MILPLCDRRHGMFIRRFFRKAAAKVRKTYRTAKQSALFLMIFHRENCKNSV